MKNISVPFNDLSRIHDPLIKKIDSKIQKMVKESSFILGKYVEEFENNYSNFTNSKYTIGCANGTDAIEIVLRALEIKQNDEVIIPSNTFIATALAVSNSGAIPVFADNDKNYLLDIEKVESLITKNTKAIIGVNLYGQMGFNKQLSEISKKYNLYFIEDSAQAHGALQNGKSPGYFSIASTYSFYPGKNLGAWGDGGCVTTNNKKLADQLLYLRNWGSKKKYFHNKQGFNSRLDPIQAIILNEKLNQLDKWNSYRNEVADYYLEHLDDSLILPYPLKYNYHVWHLFVIRIKNRNKVMKLGNENGIEFGIHYPKPIHKQKAYEKNKQYLTNIGNVDKYSPELLSLPIYPYMRKNEYQKVTNFLNNVKDK